jgi:small subunit ribosomal protein S7
MSRRQNINKREILPDAVYGDKLAGKFVSCVMRDGKKAQSERIFYGAMDIIRNKVKDDPIRVFRDAVENAKPSVEVRARRVGGATYQVPVEVRPSRRQTLAIRWLLSFSRKRGEKTMIEKLAAELLDASNNRGATIKKRDETHRMADSNKVFAHYRW